MTNRIMPLTAPGHSLMTADREEEKASLVGRHLCTSRFKVLAIRSNDLSAIWLSAQERRSRNHTNVRGLSEEF